MRLTRRPGWLASAALAVVAAIQVGLPYEVLAQRSGLANQFALSEVVSLDELDGPTRRRLAQARQSLTDQEWGEAIRTLQQVAEQSGDKVIEIAPRRYVSVRRYCQMQFAEFPAEGLAAYRSEVDPQAQRWYEAGMASRDGAQLTKLVEQAFCSQWGDDSLMALGELALERGDYAAARSYWGRVLPRTAWDPLLQAIETAEAEAERDAKFWPRIVRDHWQTVVRTSSDQPTGAGWLAFPHTTLPHAEIFARLALVSILEGSPDRAAVEIAALGAIAPGSKGRLDGREVDLVERLTTMLAASRDWPSVSPSSDWTTFAGSPARNGLAARTVDVGAVAWNVPLADATHSNSQTASNHGITQHPIAEHYALLSVHPLVVGETVFWNAENEVFAADLRTGGPRWGGSHTVYREENHDSTSRTGQGDRLGAPRYTMTAHDDRLYARLGGAETSRNIEQLPMLGDGSSYLVALDLAAEGRLIWRIEPEDEKWAFEGSPVTDGDNVYVALRRSEAQPQAHVACYDARTGKPRWRRFISAAETPAQGRTAEITHNLLSLHEGTLYLNTNLGAVAALSAADGHVQWIALYERARSDPKDSEIVLARSGGHFFRDRTPCLVHQGKLVVAPADCERVLALDAATGAVLWQSHHSLANVVHLLGVGGGNLLVSGTKLWWLNVESGALVGEFPVGDGGPWGSGRGMLADDAVYWPTADTIYVFDQATGDLRRRIRLVEKAEGLVGGNLLVADGFLLIAGPDNLTALGESAIAPVDETLDQVGSRE